MWVPEFELESSDVVTVSLPAKPSTYYMVLDTGHCGKGKMMGIEDRPVAASNRGARKELALGCTRELGSVVMDLPSWLVMIIVTIHIFRESI